MSKFKLQEKLCEQLQRSDLKPVVDCFIGKLIRDNSGLRNDPKSIAEYLTSGQGDRHLQVAQFLTAVESSGSSRPKQSAIQDLFSYLLQTLVRKYREENDQGLSRVQVEELQTVKLVGSTRTSVSFLPSYIKSTAHVEHENSQKNDKFQNIGEYIPIGGGFDEKTKCDEIATALLPLFGYPSDENISNPLKRLLANLSAYSDAPENSPLQALYIEKSSGHNPLQIEFVATKLLHDLDQLLWIYVYGGDNAQDWLYTSETKIEGLVNRYERQSEPETLQETKENLLMKQKSHTSFGNVGEGAIVTVVNGTQKDSQIGSGNTKISEANFEKLKHHIDAVKRIAQSAEDVEKSQYVKISNVINIIEQELQKESNLDIDKLKGARKELDDFKDVLSIGGGIASITQLLTMILG